MNPQRDNLRKAALVVASLDDDAADALLDGLPRAQAEALRRAVAALDHIDPREQDAAIAAFLRGAPQPLRSEPSGIELDEGLARRLGLPWRGAESLYDADTNIALGTAYLRKVLDRYGGKPYFAIAGYNAGPSPLQRWQSERPGMDADFWIETISYKETREYVARDLAFSTIYDWRLDGKAVPLTDRMHGRHTSERKSFVCPLAHS